MDSGIALPDASQAVMLIAMPSLTMVPDISVTFMIFLEPMEFETKLFSQMNRSIGMSGADIYRTRTGMLQDFCHFHSSWQPQYPTAPRRGRSLI